MIGLLNSPALNGSNGEMSEGFIMEAKIREIALQGVDQIHSTCGRPVKKISLSLGDFFDDQELALESATHTPAEKQPSHAEGKI